LLVGPVFSRELVTAPRRARFYVARAAYVSALFLLMCTAWMVLTGTQLVRNVGDLARFGAILFQILAPLQLAVAVFFSALMAASAVAHEKDRKTLILLLLTNLTNAELVLGKLLASMLNVLVLLGAAVPLFMIALLLGGVSINQVGRVFAVTLVSALAAGSLGSTLALWREKTFQALALTVLVLVFWLAGWEAVRMGALGDAWWGVSCETWAAVFSPWQAVLEATRPFAIIDAREGWWAHSVGLFLTAATLGAALLNLVAIGMVRVWNPSRESGRVADEPARASIWGVEHDLQVEQGAAVTIGGAAVPPTGTDATHAPSLAIRPSSQSVGELASAALRRRDQARSRSNDPATARVGGRTREVWDNPILWREVRTWSYGRKTLAIKLAYWLMAALAVAALYYIGQSPAGVTRTGVSLALVPLFVVSLILVNAQAVTSLTSERDAKALDLLLVTDLTPKEFIYGKLWGVLYNAKEMVAVPILLCLYLWWRGWVGTENLLFLVLGLAVMNVFVAVLGVHAGMTYFNSRQAVGVSLGTVFFLFVGVATCMRIMIAFGGSFEIQFLPFAAMAGGGGVGLFFALGARNPSPAIALASLSCPFATFYAITSFLLQMPGLVFLSVAATYGFTTAAMLIPAIYEFDVATGRTTGGED
jgi:hypothetical protein